MVNNSALGVEREENGKKIEVVTRWMAGAGEYSRQEEEGVERGVWAVVPSGPKRSIERVTRGLEERAEG